MNHVWKCKNKFRIWTYLITLTKASKEVHYCSFAHPQDKYAADMCEYYPTLSNYIQLARPGLCHLVPQLVNPLLVDPVLGKVEEEMAFPPTTSNSVYVCQNVRFLIRWRIDCEHAPPRSSKHRLPLWTSTLESMEVEILDATGNALLTHIQLVDLEIFRK